MASDGGDAHSGRVLTHRSMLHVMDGRDESGRPVVRIEIILTGCEGESRWMQFETAQQAWNALESLDAAVRRAFPRL